MRCLFTLLVLFVVLSSLILSGCGAVYISGFTDFDVASGTVSIVRVTIIDNGHGGSVSVTIVTLLQLGSTRDWTFCGLQASRFPVNSFVTVAYTPGNACATVMSVTVG